MFGKILNYFCKFYSWELYFDDFGLFLKDLKQSLIASPSSILRQDLFLYIVVAVLEITVYTRLT